MVAKRIPVRHLWWEQWTKAFCIGFFLAVRTDPQEGVMSEIAPDLPIYLAVRIPTAGDWVIAKTRVDWKTTGALPDLRELALFLIGSLESLTAIND